MNLCLKRESFLSTVSKSRCVICLRLEVVTKSSMVFSAPLPLNTTTSMSFVVADLISSSALRFSSAYSPAWFLLAASTMFFRAAMFFLVPPVNAEIVLSRISFSLFSFISCCSFSYFASSLRWSSSAGPLLPPLFPANPENIGPCSGLAVPGGTRPPASPLLAAASFSYVTWSTCCTRMPPTCASCDCCFCSSRFLSVSYS